MIKNSHFKTLKKKPFLFQLWKDLNKESNFLILDFKHIFLKINIYNFSSFCDSFVYLQANTQLMILQSHN